MSLATSDSSGAMISLQGVQHVDARKTFGDDLASRLEKWKARDDRHSAGDDLLTDPAVALFVINRDGEVSRHDPDKKANDFSESVFREFSEADGLWDISETDPISVTLNFSVAGEPMKLDQVNCPWFEAEAGDGPAGFVVISHRMAD